MDGRGVKYIHDLVRRVALENLRFEKPIWRWERERRAAVTETTELV
jgi:hypothetical protein